MKKAADASGELQELRKIPANKRCFDCNQAGTTYSIPELGIFLCSICGGIHREFNHRVKGLSTCNFSESEVSKLKSMGNEKAASIWMARYDSRAFPVPDLKDSNKLKEFLRLKYVEKRFYELRESPSEPPKTEPKPAPSAGFINLLEDDSQNSSTDPKKVQKSNTLTENPPNFFPTSFGRSNTGTNFPSQGFINPPGNTGTNSYPPQNGSNPLPSVQPTPPQNLFPNNQPNPPQNLFPNNQPNPPQNLFPNNQSNPLPNAFPLNPPNPSQNLFPNNQTNPPNSFPINHTSLPVPTFPSSFNNTASVNPGLNPNFSNPQGYNVNPGNSLPQSINPSSQTFGNFLSGPGPYNSGIINPSNPSPYPGGQNYPQSFPNSFQQNYNNPYPPQNLPPQAGYSQYPPGYQFASTLPPNPSQSFFPKSSDPFDQILEEEREKKLAQQNKSHLNSSQQLLLQQYNVQSQIYQKTYGVPYPYTFQQWLSLNSSSTIQPEPRPHSKNPFDLFA